MSSIPCCQIGNKKIEYNLCKLLYDHHIHITTITMDKLSFRISNLPQVLQDVIGMYNVEHRNMMKSVCQELRDTKIHECANGCGCSVKFKDASFLTIFGNTYIYCSDECRFDDHYDYLKFQRNLQKYLNRQLMTNN